MVDNEKIDSYLIQMDLPVQQLREGMWRVDDPNDEVPGMIISHDPPIVYLRLKVMDVPETGREKLYEKLLLLNASGVAFGAYAVENGEVFLIDTLPSETMDLSELQSSIESLILAAGEHYRALYSLAHGG